MCSLNFSYAVGSASATTPEAATVCVLCLILSPYGLPQVGAVWGGVPLKIKIQKLREGSEV